MNISIVLPCFKKVHTLKELCSTLMHADYLGDVVDLVFSIDFSGNQDIINYASSLKWPFGNKRIIAHEKNIGLRNNIFFCGDLTSDYDAVIILEDDLEVMPSFYRYAKQAAEFYDDCDKIGGISIYAYHLEEMSFTEFHPYYEGYDGCLIQWASSWGQLWTKKQWMGFRKWYSEDKDISKVNMPDIAKKWSNSWKKYYIAYLVENEKYFVFPFFSHVYNGNKAGGTHSEECGGEVFTSSPLDFSERNYCFAKFDNIKHRYDAYFQHEPIDIWVDGKKYLCEFDLFGHKLQPRTPYVITVRNCQSLEVIKSFDSGMIPMEENILSGKSGHILHLISKEDFKHTKSLPVTSFPFIRRRIISVKQSLPLSMLQLINGVKRKLFR